MRFATLCDRVCLRLATGRWFSPGPPVSSTNKSDRHDIAEILLKVALNTINQINQKIEKSNYLDVCGARKPEQDSQNRLRLPMLERDRP